MGEELGRLERIESRIGSENTNTTAKNLTQFIEKTYENKGYYIGRFEANNTSTGGSVAGKTPVRNITQQVAASAARAMYNGNQFVDSDLVNSFMWETAIVFIQKCSNQPNYTNISVASAVGATDDPTGSTNDVVCNIYEMRVGVYEWSTEEGVLDACGDGSSLQYGGVYRGVRNGFSRSDRPYIQGVSTHWFTLLPMTSTDIAYLGFRVGMWIL